MSSATPRAPRWARPCSASFALGRASTLADAAAQLADADTSAAAAVEADPQLVATYDRLRASVPGLIGELDGVASLLRVGNDDGLVAGR